MSMIVKQAGFSWKDMASDAGKSLAKTRGLGGAAAGAAVGGGINALRTHKKNKNKPQNQKKSLLGGAAKGALAGGAIGGGLGAASGYKSGKNSVNKLKKYTKAIQSGKLKGNKLKTVQNAGQKQVNHLSGILGKNMSKYK